MKRIAAMLCFLALVLTGCGSNAGEGSEPASTPSAAKQYTEESFVLLPEECVEEDTVLVQELQSNQQGEPALYQLTEAYDENDEAYLAITEHTLTKDGNWQTKEYFRKALTKRIESEQMETHISDITRGDDGNLYALLRIGETEDTNRMPFLEEGVDEVPPSYSVLIFDENQNTFQEVKLQTTAEMNDQEVDIASEYSVTNFHVKEDGTLFLVFNGTIAMWFDPSSGTQTNFCDSISDSAFVKHVGYGESEIVYYSTSRAKFGVLDAESLTLSAEMGDDIPEENRKYEWYFDTDTESWQMYAFNQSGLYRLSDFGEKASTMALSAAGSFDSLEDAVVYDILVSSEEELYLLLRRTGEDSTDYEESWEYGVVQYVAQ